MKPDCVDLRMIKPVLSFGEIKDMLRYGATALLTDHKTLYEVIKGRLPNSTFNIGKIISEQFGKVVEPEVAERDFIDAQNTATKYKRYIMELYGLPFDRFGFTDETKTPDPNIGRMLQYIDTGAGKDFPKGVSSDLQFEQRFEFFLVNLFLRLHYRALDEKPYNNISELQFRFNKQLFEGPAGSTSSIIKWILYNNENEVVEVRDDKFEGAKMNIFKMRRIKTKDQIVLAEKNSGKKSTNRQASKMTGDLLKKGVNLFDPLKILNIDGEFYNSDRQRMEFVVTKIEDIELIKEALLPFFDTNSIKEQKPGIGRGQRPRWEKAYILSFKDTPVEVLFYTIPQYLNSKNHIGKKINQGEKKGLFDGSMHLLFEQRRELELLLRMFPYEIYRLPNQTAEEYANEISDYTGEKADKIVRGELKNK